VVPCKTPNCSTDARLLVRFQRGSACRPRETSDRPTRPARWLLSAVLVCIGGTGCQLSLWTVDLGAKLSATQPVVANGEPAIGQTAAAVAPGSAPGETASAKLQQLYEQAAQRYAQIDDYVCRFRRREVLANGKVCEDMVMLRVRKQPLSLWFTWPKGSADEGREVVYVQGRFNNQLVVRTGKGDLLAGLRVELAPDSPRASANTRRSFLQAGVGYLIESLGEALREQQKGSYRYGRIHYLGRQARAESATPLECLLQEIPPGLEKYLPRGGKRYFYLATDSRLPEFGLPVLVITLDENEREVEYYCFDRFSINIGLRDEDFDPDRLWQKDDDRPKPPKQ
jgi:hypothetical protein